tara:strand:+ start:1641 stop:1796 length:156 start_codon:yes stop_codon:yes gene_type:complete
MAHLRIVVGITIGIGVNHALVYGRKVSIGVRLVIRWLEPNLRIETEIRLTL